jgi:hypothetical protein
MFLAPRRIVCHASAPPLYPNIPSCYFLYSSPGVAELADAADSKSAALRGVWVRLPPPGPIFHVIRGPMLAR